METNSIVILLIILVINCISLGLSLAEHDHLHHRARNDADTFTDEEIEAMRREREELIETNKAFNDMMNYNADRAYAVGYDDE